jgi:hypothetical protein
VRPIVFLYFPHQPRFTFFVLQGKVLQANCVHACARLCLFNDTGFETHLIVGLCMKQTRPAAAGMRTRFGLAGGEEAKQADAFVKSHFAHT